MNKEFILNNGTSFPAIGFGTYQVTGDEGVEVIKKAIELGYRYFDTATLYETERNLGRAIAESGVDRESIIVGTKVWTDERGYDNTKKAIDQSLSRMGLDYIDLCMIHWPRSPHDADTWKELNLDTWRAFEDLIQEGKLRMPGCSNFYPHHLEALIPNVKIKPVIDQLELHPGYMQEYTISYCFANDIIPMAWSPLGRNRGIEKCGGALLERLAEKYNTSWQHVALRYLAQRDLIIIPKAMSEKHLLSNMDIYGFDLTDEEMSMISVLPQAGFSEEHSDYGVLDLYSNPDQ